MKKDFESKILSTTSLDLKIKYWRENEKRLVFTNGCFDILHKGHIEYLRQSSSFGDILIVGLNSDTSVKQQNKSSFRPLQNIESRSFVLAAIEVVGAVVIFEELTPLKLIQKIQPDVLVKGGDYSTEITDYKNKRYIVGSEVVKKNGGKVEVVPLVKGYSTSLIEKKIILNVVN